LRQTHDQRSANDELPLTSSSDCHRLEMTEARAAVLRRTRRRRRPKTEHSRTEHSADARPEVDENRRLLEELRRRFASNRTIVLCKPSQSSGIHHRPPATLLTSRSADIKPFMPADAVSQPDESKSNTSSIVHRSRYRLDQPRSQGDAVTDGSKVIESNSVQEDTLEHHPGEAAPEVGEVNRTQFHISGTEQNRSQLSSIDVIPTTVAVNASAVSVEHSSLPFHHLRHWGRRHRRDKHHRGHNTDSSTTRGRSGAVNASIDDGYFRCMGRRYPTSQLHLERLKTAMQGFSCWSNDDDILANITSQWSTVSSDQRCQLQMRFERCRRGMASRTNRVAGTGRAANKGHRGNRHGLPNSWSRQVSDIMNPAKDISRIFY